MSLALADLLVDLAEPEASEEFKKSPESVMERAQLNEADKAALRSGRPGWINYQARADSSAVVPLTEEDIPVRAEVLAVDVIEVVEVVEVAVVAETEIKR